MGVTFLGCNNFQYSDVTKIIVPSTVTSAGKDMFNSVWTLDTVVIGNADVSNYNGTFFTSCGPLNYVFYAGDDYTVLTTKYSSALGKHTPVTYEQYLRDIRNPEFTGYDSKVLVYGVKTCGSCGDVDTSESGFIFEGLLNEMYIGSACKNCGAKNVTEEFAPVFVDMGYSTFELNGNCSIVQGFMIDYKSLAKYNEIYEDKIGAFGVLAVADSRVENGAAFDENGTALDGVLSYEVATGHEYFEIKITNMPLDGIIENTQIAYVDAKLHLCAYVFVGDTVHYVSEDYEGVTLGSAVSYNDKAEA